ncbi:flagellar hook assembly protein FlgD [Hoeflea prorocentri]|uniref:Basal-body rod modification protein FlgD n=1 Tax=Hoeflea prorocentri TaxID=1922333 RepID=A0A9X3UKA1_9HYPH|nr:flagellar hook assembly protein FlgD [Hoeflea prorocentri]MCY6382375.1 flagellar hook assembly protein FlgD [Hoeflea prorocentri]MDA5400175.1 flagellar hook assembly protein FlgD [Hoeflea prorocentri]
MAVDAVSGVSGATGSSAAATASQKAQVDYDTFLKLLVAEMQNQDPTKPMDATQYISQLASFSQVEQTIQTNQRLEQILAASSIGQAGSMIGRTVTSHDGSITGVVEKIELYDDGVVAILDTGERVAIGSGMTVS